MSFESTIQDLMHDADNLMAASEPVRNARPQFELETTRSLILLDETGPVGLLTRRRMREIPEEKRDQPARDFMVSVPILNQSQTLADARQQLTGIEFDADRLPVVNGNGQLVGVVHRDAIQRQSETVIADHGTVEINGDGSETFLIRSGMEVRGASDEKLGEIDEIVVERNRVKVFTVAHGLFGRHHKRIAAEHVAGGDENTLRLDFGKAEFKLLSDIEELEEDEARLVPNN